MFAKSVEVVDELLQCFALDLQYKKELLCQLYSKEIELKKCILLYDLGMITQDNQCKESYLDENKISKAIESVMTTCKKNDDFRAAVNELRDDNFHLRNDIYELEDVINNNLNQDVKDLPLARFNIDDIISQRTKQLISGAITPNMNTSKLEPIITDDYVQYRQKVIDNLYLRYDLGIILSDHSMSAFSKISLREIDESSKELYQKSQALAQNTILENFELEELYNELIPENNGLKEELLEMVDKITEWKLFRFCEDVVNYWWRHEFDDGKLSMDKQWVMIIREMFKSESWIIDNDTAKGEVQPWINEDIDDEYAYDSSKPYDQGLFQDNDEDDNSASD